MNITNITPCEHCKKPRYNDDHYCWEMAREKVAGQVYYRKELKARLQQLQVEIADIKHELKTLSGPALAATYGVNRSTINRTVKP